MLGRCKGIGIVKSGKRHAGGCAVGAPGEQPCAASRAEHPIDPWRGRVMRGFAFDRQRTLRKQRAGEIGRSHRLLAIAAMTDAHVERLALGLEPHRAAETSAFPDHDRLQFVGWVERSETHHFSYMTMMGFAALYPSYAT